jgi:glycosyltransferase involved in cell wall biosynthesis
MYCWNAGLFSEILQGVFAKNSKSAFDIIHIEHLRGSQYGVRLLEEKLSGNQELPPIVWDSVDSISYLFRQAAKKSKQGLSRFITQFELQRTEKEEARLVSLFDQVLVTSPKDKDALEKLATEETSPIDVLPNGVDLDYFEPGEFSNREPATVVVSGKMSYHANVNMVLYLVNEILPLVWQDQPQVKLWIVGKDPSKEIQDLAENPAITVTGFVESLLPYLQNASIAVAPIMYGAGIQNKVLEAMACGTPVVTNPQAISAISAKPGQDVLVGETPKEFAQAIIELLEDYEYRHQIGNAGRVFVEQNHDWKKICIQLENFYNQSING